jgi:hypothetical protein
MIGMIGGAVVINTVIVFVVMLVLVRFVGR